jgi:co-chaperonin GroES (HSP10)|tara:strand:- start:1955 stop:2347 length:393 start_codon:yes stop_codon:yes gene_type:complete
MAKIKTNGIRPIHDHVLVTDLYFGEQKTKGGIIIRDDNGTARGVYPRWARVHAKGPTNKEEYNVGDYILVEHGRWTRKMELDINGEHITLHRVDVDAIIALSESKPEDHVIGDEFNTAPDKVRPEDFGAN